MTGGLCAVKRALLPLAAAMAVAGGPVSAQGSPPAGYSVHAVITAQTAQGPQQQHWYLRSRAWCGQTADGWSPTMGTGKLSVKCQ